MISFQSKVGCLCDPIGSLSYRVTHVIDPIQMFQLYLGPRTLCQGDCQGVDSEVQLHHMSVHYCKPRSPGSGTKRLQPSACKHDLQDVA